MMLQLMFGGTLSAFAADANPDNNTITPIKHVIVIIGENRSFDHVYATYKPKFGQSISNLLSKGIIRENGTPGPNFAQAAQFSAVDTSQYSIDPNGKALFNPLPPLGTSTAPKAQSAVAPPFTTLAIADAAETDLFPTFDQFMLTGATGLPLNSVDTRLTNVNNLPSGPYQLTPSVPYDSYTGDPVHRFFQMWQQFDCNALDITRANPTGCKHDLFPWVEVTIGAGNGARPQPTPFTDISTGEGSSSMGFWNVLEGDAPYMKFLADNFAMSDNMHQSVMGGTMVNHLMFGYGDMLFFSDGKGTPIAPPAIQVENPNPQTGTNNFYDDDDGGQGNYSNCSDVSQPGVAPIVNFLESLPRAIDPHCVQGDFYVMNNVNPGFLPSGAPATGTVVPPTAQRHIGDVLMEKGISFKYYGDHFNRAAANQPNAYCSICNPFQYASDIMGVAAVREAHVQDTANLHSDIMNNTLPAVSIVKPSGIADGHPSSSKLDLFEGFAKEIVTLVQANPELWKSTAIIITWDEGGGYYDSGYTQPLDFFGDGTRIPINVVSPFAVPGLVSHSYIDHVSIIKFIEKNWKLPHITDRSRDNLPNPIASPFNPYVPFNTPAIGDLFDMFDFAHGNFGPVNQGPNE